VVVVTGSSGGLGKAIVSALHAKGCRVVCVDIVQDKNSATYKDDDRILHMTADVTDAKQVKEIPYKIQAKFDGRDATIVISNAGVMVGRKVLDFEEGQFERCVDDERGNVGHCLLYKIFRTISVNLLATYYLVRAFLPGMLSSGRGHIVSRSLVFVG
jgi:all-trans-retinol dehydrogenase (NAD+)